MIDIGSLFWKTGKYKLHMNSDEGRFVISTHRKGREERKAQKHKSLYIEEIIRPGTRMTQIKRIYTDPCVSASSVASVFYRFLMALFFCARGKCMEIAEAPGDI